MRISRLLVTTSALIALGAPLTSTADTVWSFGGSSCLGPGDTSPLGVSGPAGASGTAAGVCNTGDNNATTQKVFEDTLDTNDVRVTAWSNTGTGGTVEQQVSNTTDANNPTGVTRYQWTDNGQTKGGLGMLNKNETSSNGGNHAVDNINEVDGLMFDFGSNWALTSVQLGWEGSDSDLSVLRWIGQGAAIFDNTKTWAQQLATDAWELVGNYADVYERPAGSVQIQSSTDPQLFSSAWLIAGYSSANFGDTCNEVILHGSNHECWAGNDAFKIWDLTGVSQPTGGSGDPLPEPGTVLLMGLGLVGLVARKRRCATVETYQPSA